jgi:hypothetical protein
MVRTAVVGRTVEVPPQFIALCKTIGVSPQAALRGMAAMVCGLRYVTTTAWCRWKAKPREVCPGAGGACPSVLSPEKQVARDIAALAARQGKITLGA